MNNENFHNERLKGIGGSDVPVLLGKSPYKTPYQLYLEKLGLLEPEPEPDNGPLYFGKRLESMILQEFCERMGKEIVIADLFYKHPDNEFMVGHLDAMIPHGGDIEEAKTSGQYMASDWGEELTDEVPEPYILQCQHYMAITGAKMAWLPVLIGGNDFRVYRIFRNDNLINNLIEIEKSFWFDNVLAKNTPPVDSSDRTAKALTKLFPRDTGETIEATDDIIKILKNLEAYKRQEDDQKKRIELQKNKLKIFLQDKSALTYNNKIMLTWKKSTDSLKTDYKAIVAELQPDESIIRKYQKTVAGSRRFLPKYKLIQGVEDENTKQ